MLQQLLKLGLPSTKRLQLIFLHGHICASSIAWKRLLPVEFVCIRYLLTLQGCCGSFFPPRTLAQHYPRNLDANVYPSYVQPKRLTEPKFMLLP